MTQILTPDETRDTVLARVRGAGVSWFLLLDAAHDERIWPKLYHSNVRYQCLYDGQLADQYASVAPYLAQIDTDNPSLLHWYLENGWGEAWGYLLSSQALFEQIRRHLRRFLMVKNEVGDEVCFRFYDPRVLRVFLASCDAGERAHFYGPIESFVLENAEGKLVRLQADDHGLESA